MSDFDQPSRRRWVISTFVAITILIVLFGLAFLISGRQVFERPILIFFILLAWFGTLGGFIVSR